MHLRNGDDFGHTYEALVPVLDAIAAVTVPREEVVRWLLEHRPCGIQVGGLELLAANPFDAALAGWLIDQGHVPATAVGEAELEEEQLACCHLLRQVDRDRAPEFRKLLTYASLQRVLDNPAWLSEVDFSVSGLNILYGMVLREGSLEGASRAMAPVFDAVLAVEQDWSRSLAELPACTRILRVGPRKRKVRICAFESDLVSMTRAVRYRYHPDLCIHRDPALETVGMTLVQHRGPLREYTFDGRGGHPGERGTGEPRLDSLVARVRLAEARLTGEDVDLSRINDVGMVAGWYLHQSLRIFAKGSRKARDVPATRIPFEALTDLVATVFDPTMRLPALWCDADGCGECPFGPLHLPNCSAGS
jgi:hypothetical protein